MFTRLLTNSLSNSSTEIVPFPSGEECLKRLEQGPQIVILDYYLNGNNPNAMNGMQVLKKIKKEHPQTDVIMLSSQEGIDVAIDTLKEGAYDYVTKGANAVIRVRNLIRRIADRIELTDNMQEETSKIKKINILVIVAFVLLFVLGRIL